MSQPLLPHAPAADLEHMASDLLGIARDLERIAATTEGHVQARAQVARWFLLVAVKHLGGKR